MTAKQTIRSQLAPLIRSAGIREVSRITKISHTTLSQWLNEKTPAGSSRPRTINDGQIEAIAAAVGASVAITKGRKKP